MDKMKDISYALVVGSIMYAQVCTYPDIAFVVEMLGMYLSNPGINHWIAVKKVLSYLQRTKGFALTYRTSDHLELVRYTDAFFAGCVNSKKSTLGYMISTLLKIYCDNSAAVNFSNNNKHSSMSKHIDIKYLVVKERVQNCQVSVELIDMR
ncbi:secreted RxLR effector protein 161-like [Magnolia sinica]|uniref:secreted RxLR effector protein 161-like n=1 Tax=Magnolia sinica TaxID=86752 RepID=UPI0026593EA2|nr:secreted RxLR effector protein 161-like [Magnolia sinica]